MAVRHEVKISGTYRGLKIEYYDGHNKPWSLMIGKEEGYSGETLESVKRYADRFLSDQFKPIEAIIFSRDNRFLFRKDLIRGSWGGWNEDGEIRKITVTSIDDEGRVWIKTESGRREKVDKDVVLAPTPDNLNKIAQMKAKEKDKSKIQKEIDQLEKSLERAIKKEV